MRCLFRILYSRLGRKRARRQLGWSTVIMHTCCAGSWMSFLRIDSRGRDKSFAVKLTKLHRHMPSVN